MPCVGTTNRLSICEDILEKIYLCIERYPQNDIIFGGDFNVNMGDKNPVSDCITQFASVIGLHRCDQLFLGAHYSTYYNEHLNSYSTIDFLLTSNDSV